MDNNDYYVIVYKILLYLYAIFERKIKFEKVTFEVLLADVDEEYINGVLRMQQQKELIEGAIIIKAWGAGYVLMNDISEISITEKGIEYLRNDQKMREIGKTFSDMGGIIATLKGIVWPE